MKETHFSETQPFWLTLFATGLLCSLYIAGNLIDGGYTYILGEPRFYIVLLLFLSPIMFWGTMNTQVTSEEIIIRFGLFPFRKRIISLTEITEVQRSDIKWLKDFKFVGVTYGQDTGDIGYFVSYGSGVRVTVGEFTTFIGSRRADEFSRNLKAALRTVQQSMAQE